MRKMIWFAILSLVITGCLEKKEKLSVSETGEIQVNWKISGDKKDAHEGLQLPQGSSWTTREWQEVQENGKEKFFHQAQAQFVNMDAYLKAMSLGEEDLQVQGYLKIERTNKGSFYHFERLYLARDLGKFQAIKKEEIDPKLGKQVSQKGIYSLSPKNQQKYIQGLINFEIRKRILLVCDALGKTYYNQGGFPLSLIDKIKKELKEEYKKSFDYALVQEILSSPKQKLPRKIKKIEEKLTKKQKSVLENIFQEYPQVDYQKNLQKTLHGYKLSEDLTDESFELTLTLPGKIITTNGVKVNQNTVTWKFHGKELIGKHIPCQALSVTEK